MKPAPCASKKAKLFAMEAIRLSAMGMERFALTTCARWGRFDAVDAMPLSDDAARDDSKHGRRRVRV